MGRKRFHDDSKKKKSNKVKKNKYPKKDKVLLSEGVDIPIFSEFIPENQLDLHKFGEIHPGEAEIQIERFINQSYAEGFNKVLVITGKGLVLRPLAKKVLKKHSKVKSFQPAGFSNGQDGAFEVVLRS